MSDEIKVLHGCGHSFHLLCFPFGKDICSICKDELTSALKNLSSSALHSIHNPGQHNVSENAQMDDVDEEDDEEPELEPSNPERDEASIAESVMKLQQEIFSWGMVKGP